MNQEEIRKQFEVWAYEKEYELETAEFNNKTIYTSNLTRNALLGYLAGYQAALTSKQKDIKQGLDDIQLSMSMFANKEDYLKAVEEQEHIESNQELAQRLSDACEGELEGIVVDIETSKRILDYVLNKLL